MNCKSQFLNFQLEYYSSRVITPDSARYSYPSNSRIPSFFRVAKRGRVICQNLLNINQNLHFTNLEPGLASLNKNFNFGNIT